MINVPPICPAVEGAAWEWVGVLGATSLVGECLLPLLMQANCRVMAYSRKMIESLGEAVEWRRLNGSALAPHFVHLQKNYASQKNERAIHLWVCVAPIWVLPEYFALLEAQGAQRVVVLSSTSRYSKEHSNDAAEQAVSRRFADAEARVQEWAEHRGIEWVILRPTLIYGLGRDKNITEIARFIRRFGFFPLFGKAKGFRQPIHAVDVAAACLSALQAPCAGNHAYNISGGETLTYRDMVVRVFRILGRSPRMLPVSLPAFSAAIALLRHLPRYRKWSSAMAERMNQDMVFDHSEAERDLCFRPGAFKLTSADIPK